MDTQHSEHAADSWLLTPESPMVSPCLCVSVVNSLFDCILSRCRQPAKNPQGSLPAPIVVSCWARRITLAEVEGMDRVRWWLLMAALMVSAAAALAAQAMPSATLSDKPLSQRWLDYNIDARVNAQKHTIDATEVLTWHNFTG